MAIIQSTINKLEGAGGARFVRIGLAALAVIIFVVAYNVRCFKNMSTLEAMDAAQVARNLAQGKGYTTLCVRPLSIYLLKRHNQNNPEPAVAGKLPDPARIKGMHPDLANPPVYPVVLAGLMKLLPFQYQIDVTHPFWSIPSARLTADSSRQFWRYQPDFLIAAFNELLFFALIVLVFLLARRLFDPPVAWLSAIVLLGTEMYWRFAVSGLSTMLLLLFFLGLAGCLVLLEQEVRTPKWGPVSLPVLAALAGMLVGFGGLTRYSFGWLILPVLLFLVLFGGPRRVILVGVAFLAFAVILTPWAVRNYHISGAPFGTATYAVMENSALYQGDRLQRSLEPNLGQFTLMAFWIKLMVNLRQIAQNDLTKLGGSWVSAFFLVGLLINFHNLAIRRLRYFLLMCIGVLAIAQALGRTQLSEESPEFNSENLLVLVAPLVLVYGVSLFYLLLDQLQMPFHQIRYAVIGCFGVLACLPMIFTFLPPSPKPIAYPPYFPPSIQQIAGWIKENELIMSDMPWAVAWYGQRQSVWFTLRATPDPKDPGMHEDFFAINDYQKPINALYLTPLTMDARFLSQWIRAGELSWGSFILEVLKTKEMPPMFPLRKMPTGFLPEQIVLTDWERWRKTP